MTLCQYFGWRASTAATLRLEHISGSGNQLDFGTFRFKGKREIYPVGIFFMPDLPHIQSVVANWILHRIKTVGK